MAVPLRGGREGGRGWGVNGSLRFFVFLKKFGLPLIPYFLPKIGFGNWSMAAGMQVSFEDSFLIYLMIRITIFHYAELLIGTTKVQPLPPPLLTLVAHIFFLDLTPIFPFYKKKSLWCKRFTPSFFL